MARVATRRATRSLWHLKRKAPGLLIIACFGALHCVPAGALLAESPDWRNHLDVLSTPVMYVMFIFFLVFGFIKYAELSSSPTFTYFRDFNIWKGAACILVAPALSFWIQLVRNFHYALDTANPFLSALIPHAVFTFFALLLLVAVTLQKVWRATTTRTSSRISKPLQMPGGWIPNILWTVFFFRGNAGSPFGPALSALVGGAYLAFVYLTIASGLAQSMAVKTQGTVVSAKTMVMMYASKYGSHRAQYCLLTIQTDHDLSRFALPQCLPCMMVLGNPVTVEHNPIDYFSRRSNTAQCDAPEVPHQTK